MLVVRIRGDGDTVPSPFAYAVKCGGECGLLMPAPKSFLDARLRARERAFVVERPVGIGAVPRFNGGGNVTPDGDSGPGEEFRGKVSDH